MTRTTTARRRQAAQERRESCLLHFMGLKLRASAARVSSSEGGGDTLRNTVLPQVPSQFSEQYVSLL